MQSIDITKPLFQPETLNLNYIFEKIYAVIKLVVHFLTNPHTWAIVGIISISISIFFIGVIIFSLVRLVEMQVQEKKEIEESVEKAAERKRIETEHEHPKWHRILTLGESASESDWKMAIMEADSLVEESLKNKGVPGDTMSELLEAVRENGYSYIQDIWEAHLIRNQIAHKGSDYSISRIETRRVLRMFENFLEELGVI